MNKLSLTTRLNLKTVGVVLIFMFIVTAYGQWILLQEEKSEYMRQLETITAFIAVRLPEESFTEIVTNHGAVGKPVEEQVMVVNAVIQPILTNILLPDGVIKYSVYSKCQKRIVAVGPSFDKSLLVTINPEVFNDIYKTDAPKVGQRDNSIIWYGAPMLYNIRPIHNNGQVIGHVFACANLDLIKANLWQKTIKTLLGGLVALLIAIMFFQEIFINLKKDLNLFAEAIIKGKAKHFESQISELTPVLHYISEQTEHMARLDRLNLIGEMAASIGHEVRNPMTTVRGFLQYLAGKQEMSSCKEYFTLMMDELDRANSIITEFLSLAKNKAMNFTTLNLNQVITEVAPLLQADVLRYHCQIELNLDTIPYIKADKSSMRQLVLNLVRNAIEAMPQGGTIFISTVHSGTKVLLSIKDQGVGIPPEILDKLGTPFVTTKPTGTGLGLAVCYRIVHRHEASIEVESQPGQGTTFTIGLTVREDNQSR